MLDNGIYTVSEAAKYTGIPVSSIHNWFIKRPDGLGNGPIFTSDYERVDGDFAISFLNMIEAYVAASLREHKIKPSLIRRAHQVLSAKMGPHPFAHADLRPAGERIVSLSGDNELIDALSNQRFFEHVGPYLHPILYSIKTKIAEAWRIAEGVVINPKLGFGKPVIESTGISTLIVANLYQANKKNAALVARLYKLTESGVQNAYRFERGLGRVAA